MQMALKIGSLFSGIGGIELGFQQAGFNVLWTIEKNMACCKTYRHNFRKISLVENDIRTVNPYLLSKVDVIIAGFPCQPFSIAGRQCGFSDPRGSIFYEVGKFISANQPRFVFLENVPNLMNHDNGKTFNIVHNVLAELNFSIRYRVLRASEYGGIPQIRDRIYIITFRQQRDCDSFVFPEKTDLHISIEDVLERTVKKNDIYYYSVDDPFYQKASKIVKSHDSIYRVYHDSIKITRNHMCPTLTASIPFVKKISYRGQIVFALVGVKIIRNRNKSYIVFGEKFLGKSPDFNIISAES